MLDLCSSSLPPSFAQEAKKIDKQRGVISGEEISDEESEEIEEIEGEVYELEDGMEVELDDSETEETQTEVELQPLTREQEEDIDPRQLQRWERYWRHNDPGKKFLQDST